MNDQQNHDVAGLAVSVVVPVYNGSETLAECLEALCNQTLEDDKYEIIVIDDSSTDETPEIIASFAPRVRCDRLEENQGRLTARRTGAELAACEQIFFCDSRVICEADLLAKALTIPDRPLMFGSDRPDTFHATIYGRFLYCVYRKLWPSCFPQGHFADRIALTAENFNSVPKGFGFFLTDRDFFLRHQPKTGGKHVSDDTLVLQSMVSETPVIRCADLHARHVMRNDLSSALAHLHGRGILFNSYYLKPGGEAKFFALYLALWACVLGIAGASLAGLVSWWALPVTIGAMWLGASLWFADGIVNFLAVATVLPIVVTFFASGIMRGHVIDLREAVGRQSDEGRNWPRMILSFVILVGIAAAAAWYVRGHWDEFRAVPMLPWWGWPVVALFIVALHLGGGMMIDIMIRPHGIRLRPLQWVGLSFLTALGNLLGPMRTGMVLRSVYLKRKGLGYALFMSSLGGTYVLSTLANMIIAMIGLLTLHFSGMSVPPRIFAIVGAMLGGMGVMALWAPPAPKWLHRIFSPAGQALDGWRTILTDRKTIAQAMAVCLFNMVVYTGMFWVIYTFMGQSIHPGAVAAICGIASLAAMIAITPGAVGFFELVAIWGGTYFGITPQVGLVAMLIFRVVDTAMTITLGTLATWLLMRSPERAE